MFGAFNLAAFIHVFFMFPETAGRTLEEIEAIFEKGHTYTAWQVDRRVGLRTLEQVVELKDGFTPAHHPPGSSVGVLSSFYRRCEDR
jgi:hypothetical protein